MIEKTIHDLAVTYASSKLSEYEIDKREAHFAEIQKCHPKKFCI